ncbi:type 2 periplasmic-binding domain-containing protein [Parenemella sanctibonifatiensis]|uniref:Extracellular solute-binding protein n=1 Tax=Parenemella sanctibonifatiensis TaxID=2016505 RepID=A0A255EWX3_9ACTN|nr:extracellular solute-binding protein [Parenemella sanctibonifatiensis]OYN92623.1 hypothetical protein CGZ91_03880 [Parenemella sanctibonifatiensis]
MVSRRQLLGGTGAAALAVAGLSACGPNDTPAGGRGGGGGGDANAGVEFPTYVPLEFSTPDLPSDGENSIPAGYFSFPDSSEALHELPFPESEPFSMMAQMNPDESIRPDNQWYQKLATDMGNKFEMINGTFTEYKSKYTVVLASGDLPDFLQMQSVPQYPAMLEKNFTDFTPYISGDNIKEFPGLASIPTESWNIPLVNGKFWGVVQPRPPAGRILSVRNDLLAERGIEENPTVANGEEFLDLCRELTGDGKFAFASDPDAWVLRVILEMTGAPNNWSVEGGKFTNWYETEAYEQALEITQQMWQEKLIHPEAIANPGNNFAWLSGGVSTLYAQGFTGWATYAQQYPDWNMGFIELPKWDGGGVADIHKSEAGYATFIGMSKQPSEERTLALLRILDYLASPFGTQEYQTIEYGIEGRHFNFDDGGNPTPISAAVESEKFGGLRYAGTRPYSQLYLPGQEELVRAQHAYLTEKLPTAKANASSGLYSETATGGDQSFSKTAKDARLQIIQGRQSLSTWADVVQDWKNGTGDTVRGEYEEAYAEANG